MEKTNYFVHESARVDQPAQIGPETKIWHFSHVMAGAQIGAACSLGQNVFVAATVRIGDHVKVQNNVSLYDGVELEDYVFCGPSCVFTNVINPRAEIERKDQYRRTLVRRGSSIGANATIICGTTVGSYALVGAGAVLRRDAPDYALMLGVPAARFAWISRHGHRLWQRDGDGNFVCPQSGWRYRETQPERLRCLDWAEDRPLAKD